MSITVNTNMQALRIQQNLSNATSKMNTAMERMSSGYKINSAKDDAAGLAVSTKLETTISSSKVASDNVQIGSNLLDTAEGTMDVILKNLQRIRDLTEQASNGTYSAADQEAIAAEVNQRVVEINRSANSTTFNGTSLFDNDTVGTDGVDLQIGTGSDAADKLNLDSSIFKNATVSSMGLFSVGAGNAISVRASSTAGATTQLFNSAGDAYTSDGTGATSMEACITDMFKGEAFTAATAAAGEEYSISNFLNNADDAISNVTDRVTKIGAYQNRLESITESLEVQQTNLTAANSTIKDADVAEESAAYVQSQILQSASASLLTQANSAPQVALTLIQG